MQRSIILSQTVVHCSSPQTYFYTSLGLRFNWRWTQTGHFIALLRALLP